MKTTLLLALSILLAGTTAAVPAAQRARGAAKASAPVMKVTKRVGCGCCEQWADHLRAAGFIVNVTESAELDAVKRAHGVPASLASCHTGTVGGYVVEGHVPADVVQKMLREKPAIAGIAVAGMPIGSPGMEGGTPQPYDVVAFRTDGTTTVYAKR